MMLYMYIEVLVKYMFMCISSLMLGLSGTIPGLPRDGKVQYMGHGGTEIVSSNSDH